MTNLPTSFSIDSSNKMYYNAKEIYSNNPELFKGYKTKHRQIIQKRNIPNNEYVYACFNIKFNRWDVSSEVSLKAQLLITKEWVDIHMFNISPIVDPVIISITAPAIIPITAPAVSPIVVPPVSPIVVSFAPPVSPIVVPVAHADTFGKKVEDKKQSQEPPIKKKFKFRIIDTPQIEDIEEDRKDDQPEIENAPPILELEDEEKFHDTDGNILEIEMRGERDRNKIYFKVKDVMKAFNMEYLDLIITRKESGYDIELHYKCFTRYTNCISGKNNTKKAVKALYLTYTGLLRVLFVSRNKNAEKFTIWAITKLFTMQMGTKENKEVLGTEILNIKLENYRAVFGKCPQNFPCIYLVELGKVGALRETFGISETINDELIVYKYGFTCDLKRRLSEHERDYGKQKNVNLDLVLFHYIDLKYTSEAEADIRDIFDSYDISLNVSGRTELIVLTKKQFERTKKEYIRTGNAFAGATRELQEEIARLKTEIIEMRLKHQLEVQEYKHRAEHAEFVNNLKEQHYQEIRVLIDKMNR